MTEAKNDYALYWGSGSPFAWRVLIYLHEKQLTYDSHLIEFSKAEHKTEEYMKMNPRGKVPVLVDQTVTPHIYLFESMAILHYLERKHGPLSAACESTTTQESLQLVANSLVRAHEVDSYLLPVLQPLLRECWFKPQDQWNLDLLRESLTKVKEELTRWEQYLSSATKEESTPVYLNGGGEFTVADAVGGPIFLLLDRFGFDFVDNGHQHLANYVRLVKERDSVQKSFPPHWRGSTNDMYAVVKQKLNL